MNRGCLHGLWDKPEYVPNGVAIIRGDPTFSGKNFASLGYPVLYHLAADGACLAGGQVTVVAIGQVDANLASCLHLETVQSLASLGNIDLVVVLHTKISPLLSSDENTFRRKHFLLRSHSLASCEICMNVNWRKDW